LTGHPEQPIGRGRPRRRSLRRLRRLRDHRRGLHSSGVNQQPGGGAPVSLGRALRGEQARI